MLKINEYLIVGKIVTAHGVRGICKVQNRSEYEKRFAVGARLYLINGQELHVETASGVENLLVKFVEINDRSAAEALRSQLLYIPKTEAAPLPAGRYYPFQLEGLAVYNKGQYFGELIEVIFNPANDIYLTKTASGKEVCVPALKTVIKEVNLEQGKMEVVLPEGLIDED